MYSKDDLIKAIKDIGIKPTDTLLIHSSMKAVGEVEGGGDTVIDAFMECLKDGLLIFPTHTWEQINNDYNIFYPETEPSCVGILGNLFMKRPNVIRSLHPTHSVAAYGADAKEYVKGEENSETPCAREGCWGKLYDRGAKILFLGCSLKSNTFIHGVEEWCDIPDRLTEEYVPLKIAMPDGTIMDRPSYRHSFPAGVGNVSHNYDKMLEPYIHKGIANKAFIGDAESVLCDAVGMADYTEYFLKKKPDLFDDKKPIPKDWYID